MPIAKDAPTSLKLVCPLPWPWMKLKDRLKEAARTYGIPSPPGAIVLAGWNYSSDYEKWHRWQETLAWASRHGFTALLDELLANLNDESMYFVVGEISHYTVGPLGGPMYLDWNCDPKPKLDHDSREILIATLRSNWVDIVGNNLGNITFPVRLTGTKGRKLLVAVRSGRKPPWGSWTTLASSYDRRRTFTAFRKAINHAISPHVVDHIDFIFGSIRSFSRS
jgi:hypothetical protein